MKRKGRQHLPKVGSKPQRRYSQQHQRDAVADNYGIEVEKHTTAEKIGAGVIGVIIACGAIAILFFT